MSERVAIANEALTAIGENPITGFEDETNAALVCKTHYGPTRDALLEEAEWNFATKMFDPAQTTASPLYEWDYQFQIPADCLRVTDVWPSNLGVRPFAVYDERSAMVRPRVPHRIMGRLILANEDIYASGIFRIEEEGHFTPSFRKCLAYALAADIALPLTKNAQIRADMMQMKLAYLKKAEGLDGMANSMRQMRTRAIIGRR